IMAFAKLGDNNRVWELLNMINPVNHGKTAEEIATYKVEPYVLAADVYSRTPHAGRGGMDLVHRFGKLVVSFNHRIFSWPATGRK
ncbi:MAG TPA: hypothetical protein VIL78_20240, partial [Hanamia sp.]